MAKKRFVGTTYECFENFMSNPQLNRRKLLADFCKLKTLVTIEKWNDPEGHRPTGMNHLRLMCFLDLAGYEVLEMKALDELMRFLAWYVALGKGEPGAVEKVLGYKTQKIGGSLWRLLLEASGYGKDAKDAVGGLKRQHNNWVKREIEKWRVRVTEVIDPPTTETVIEMEAGASLPTMLATSLQRSLITSTSLAQLLLDPDGKKAVLEATRGGADILELIEHLQEFVSSEE